MIADPVHKRLEAAGYSDAVLFGSLLPTCAAREHAYPQVLTNAPVWAVSGLVFSFFVWQFVVWVVGGGWDGGGVGAGVGATN